MLFSPVKTGEPSFELAHLTVSREQFDAYWKDVKDGNKRPTSEELDEFFSALKRALGEK